MAQRPLIAVGGENLIDHVTRDGEVAAHPGGSPFNVAMALGRLGANVAYITPISTDDWGARLADTLEASGVDLRGGRRDEPTTLSRVTVTKGIPSYDFQRDATAERQVTTESLSSALPDEARAVHTGSLTLTDGPDADAWEAFCTTCADRGLVVSLDPNVRLSVIKDRDAYRARILRMAAHAHLVKLSDEDLSGLFPDLDADAAIATISEAAPRTLLVMTRGPKGVSIWQDGARRDLPAPKVTSLVDTVGAGDTFMAATLAGLAREGALSPDAIASLEAAGLDAILTEAMLAAAINCAREGCDPPTRNELDAAMQGAN
ncbi:carbohydrate kinase [Palleronia sp. LCG004]|uniref:carbohydrate kinase family protein n=1 Tax=Palleronia sp. LCG004 TaxID=3079304 RepID=UPI002942C1CD|nr:carbohydrate kinase [Palleronia sp. LCG004]WOI56416.1 carbohydrate kinase [Palleronia sp. LCG004]